MPKKAKLSLVLGAAGIIAGLVAPASAVELPPNDYPTVARADYVFACMQVNGESRENLFKCSCSIDKISEILSYDDYEEAETIMSVMQKGGEKVAPLRYKPLQDKIKRLKRAQVEAELLCF